MGKGLTMDFSEAFVVYDIKVGRCSQLNEYMNFYEYQRSRSCINIFKLFCLETARLIETKFREEPPLDGEWKWVYKWFMSPDNDDRHAIHKKHLLLNWKADNHSTWYAAASTRVLISLFKWCVWVNLDLIYARSNLVCYDFVWEKSKNNGFLRNYLECRPKMTMLPPRGNFADIVYLEEQSFLHKIRDVCTL